MTRPFCAPVHPEDGECLPSVLFRAAEANAISRVSKLLHCAGIAADAPAYLAFGSTLIASRLSVLLGVKEDAVLCLLHPRVEGHQLGSVNWFGTPLERRFIEARERRYSPSSLRRSPHGRASWMLRPLLYCAESGELLRNSCPSCGNILNWNNAQYLTKCGRCRGSLIVASDRLGPDFRRDLAEITGLLSTDPHERACVLASLPHPFRSWRPGDVFSAAVELGVIAANPGARFNDPIVRQVAGGDFTSLGSMGLFQGWQAVKSWPHSLTHLVTLVVDSSTDGDIAGLQVLGLFTRHLISRVARTPFRHLLRNDIRSIIDRLHLPIYSRKNRKIFPVSRDATVSTRDARDSMHISGKTLLRLREGGSCFRAGPAAPAKRGVRLFDRDELLEAVTIYRNGISADVFARLLGAPKFVLPAFIEMKLVRPVANSDAVRLNGGRVLLDPSSVECLIGSVAQTATLSRVAPVASLRSILRSELSPWVWAGSIQGILLGRVPGVFSADERGLVDSLMVESASLAQFIEPLRAMPLPDVDLPGHVAGPLAGLNRVVAWDAVRKGLLEPGPGGISLRSLASFRRGYVAPAEVSQWWSGTSSRFCILMRAAGAEPAAVLNKSNVWRRGDVERIFPESRIVGFDRT